MAGSGAVEAWRSPAGDFNRTLLRRVVLLMLATVLVGLLLHGWNKVYDDGAADRVVVGSAWAGVDPYLPIPDLYDEVGLEGGGFLGIQPRPPGAFIVQAPSILIPVEYAGVVNIVVGSIALAAICLISGRLADWRFGWWTLLVLFSFPVLSSLRFGNAALFYMALITWSIADRGWGRGIALGVAAAARLWPALLILAFWLEGRRKAALAALATMTLLCLGGLALPSVTLEGAIQGLRHAEAFFGQHSFALPGPPLLWPALAVLLVLRIRSLSAAVPAGALTAPISWGTYYLPSLPSVLSLRAWGPAVCIGFLAAIHPAFMMLGGFWLTLLVARQSDEVDEARADKAAVGHA